MPRSTDEILAQAELLADQFEAAAGPGHLRPARELELVRRSFLALADRDRRLGEAVVAARQAGHSWAAIGAMLGTSGEAARQRYGHQAKAG